MKPHYALLLVGSYHPQASGLSSPPLALVSTPLVPKSHSSSSSRRVDHQPTISVIGYNERVIPACWSRGAVTTQQCDATRIRISSSAAATATATESLAQGSGPPNSTRWLRSSARRPACSSAESCGRARDRRLVKNATGGVDGGSESSGGSSNRKNRTTPLISRQRTSSSSNRTRRRDTNGSAGTGKAGAVTSSMAAVSRGHGNRNNRNGNGKPSLFADSLPGASTTQQILLADAGGGDDPTAAAHDYLADFLGMSEEELGQLSTRYRSLPPGQRGPDEITVAGPELASAATKAAEAAAAAVLAEAEVAVAGALTPEAAVVDTSSSPRERDGGSFAGDGRDGGGDTRRVATKAETEAIRAAADTAAAAAEGRVLIAEVPAVASVLHVQLGVPKERVKRLLLKWPRLLEVSGHHVMHCVQWLAGTVGMTKEEVAKILLSYPPVLIKSVNFQLKTNLDWLEGWLGLTRPETRKVVCTVPQLLTKSVSSNFLPKLQFLDKALGIRGDAIGDLLVRYPQLFNPSLDNMVWKAHWLENDLLMDQYQIKRVITRCPHVFAYSAERNLVPTLAFFMDELGATRVQVRQAVMKQPRLLGMSLENRLKPRLRIIREAGYSPSWELHHEVVLFASDIVFRRWLREEPTGGARRRRAVQGGLSQTGRRHH